MRCMDRSGFEICQNIIIIYIQLVLDVSPTHWRVQAIILSNPSNKLLIINSYFPTDHRVNEFDTTDLFSTLSAINSVFMENEYALFTQRQCP